MIIFYVFIFLASCGLLFISGRWLIDALDRIARFLQWREFVVTFLIVAFATSIPDLFVGITSALYKIPQLAFGDVIGGNLVDLTIAVALATLFAGGLFVESKMAQTSSLITMIIAILPMALVADGYLGRADGMVLILAYFAYIIWLFSKKERFSKAYDGDHISIRHAFQRFIKDVGLLVLGLAFLLAASQGIVKSAVFFSNALNIPLFLVGALVVGVGNTIPETYFAIIAARKKGNWMILGDLMGSIIVCATLVLGVVALIAPIKISDFTTLEISRFFLLFSALFFFLFIRSSQKVNKKEAVFLLLIYAAFLSVELFSRSL